MIRSDSFILGIYYTAIFRNFWPPPPKKKKVPYRAIGEKKWRKQTAPKVDILRRYFTPCLAQKILFLLGPSLILSNNWQICILKYSDANLRVNDSWGRIGLSGGVALDSKVPTSTTDQLWPLVANQICSWQSWDWLPYCSQSSDFKTHVTWQQTVSGTKKLNIRWSNQKNW